MSSEKYVLQISLSSDTINSPERSTDFELVESDCSSKADSKVPEPKLIVISDTELEEGEIDDEEEEGEKEKTGVIKKKQIDNVATADQKRKHRGPEIPINKRRRFEEPDIEELLPLPENDMNAQTEEFAWSELRMLMVGDERVVSLNWEEWEDFPEQELYHVPHCNLSSLCTLAEKHLYKEYDVVFLLGFHYDFICFEEDGDSAEVKNDNRTSTIDLKPNIDISEIIKTVEKLHYKWVRQYPNTYIIWTIPSPPDFLKFNSFVLKERGLDPEKTLDKTKQHKLSKEYFELCRELTHEWKEKIGYVPMFPLNRVLFMKKNCYKRSFVEAITPKFPRGFLRDGFYPTKMMAIYCAYLLVEYFIDEGFFPKNKASLNLAEAEAKLMKFEPDTKVYFHANERHGRKRPKHSRHHSNRFRKDNSLSPHTSDHSRSRSRLGRRHQGRSKSRQRYRTRSGSKDGRHRTRSTSKERRTMRSRSRERHKMRSRSRSGSVSREGRRRLRSKMADHRKPKRRSEQRHRSSTGSSSLSLPSSPEGKKPQGADPNQSKAEKLVPEETKRRTIKDEVTFWKTLRDLREVHDIQCVMYRRKPHTHPRCMAEKERFFKNFQQKLPGEMDLSKWDDYWRQKIEEVFEESWSAKKKQLTIDLNQKGTFTSLNSFADITRKSKDMKSSKVGGEKSLSIGASDERSKFKQENVDTINSYLNEFESTLESVESQPTEKPAATVEACDFTLADIFKDVPKTREVPSSVEMEEKQLSGAKLLTNHSRLTPVDSPGKPSSPASTRARDLPPSFDPKSEENSESSQSIESDVDVDNLMDNPDFLQGLEEIDKELQNAVLPNGKVDDTDGQTVLPSLNDISKVMKDEEAKQKVCGEEEVKLEFVNVLKMLFRVSKRLGPLGLSVSALYHRASEDLRNKREKFPSLNSDSKSLLALVDKKLNLFLKENLPQVQKAIYGEISERLQVLLDQIDVEHDKFQKVNVHSIAVATLGQEVSQVVSFIKNTLLYHGYTQFTSDDVMNIYMSVKASQLDMEKS